jgi:hypothetical protein
MQNFQGLGFSFSAKDGGLQRYLKTTSSLSGEMSQSFDKFGSEAGKTSQKQGLLARGFNFIGDSVHSLWSMMKKAGSTLFNWVTGAPKKIMQVADAVSQLSVATDSNTGLTSHFEQAALEANVSSRKIIAATGMFGKELDRASGKAAGLVMGMKTSASTAGHAVASMEQFGKELKAVGIDSAETAVKLEDGLGVGTRDLAFNLHKMQVGLKLSDKELGELGKSFTATGETIHDMVKPLQNMPQVLELAQKRSNLVAQGMSSIGGKESVKSINRAIQSLFVLTGDSKAAQEGAVALESKMVESMENFRNMFTGTSTDLDKFLINTSVVTGDVRKAFKAAENGPDAFIKEFSGVIAKLKKDGKKTSDILQFFGGQMSEALGPDLANTLITALANADEAKMKTMRGLKETGKSIGQIGKEAWRSNMTLAESFELMTGAAMASFRSISAGEAQTFVRDTQKSYAAFNETAQKLVNDKGPLGSIVKKMSLLMQIGPMALVPESLRGSVQVFGQLYKSIMPAVEQYQKFTSTLFGSLAPIASVTIGIAGIGVMINDAMEKAKKKALNQKTGKYEDQIWGWTKVNGKLVKKQITRSFKTVGAMWGAEIKDFVQDIVTSINDWVSGKKGGNGMFSGILDNLKDLFNHIPWSFIWAAIKQVWATIKNKALQLWNEYVVPFAKGFWKGLTGALDPSINTEAGKTGQVLGSWIKGVWDEFVDWAQKVWNEDVKPFFEGLWTGISGKELDPSNTNPAAQAGAGIGKWIKDVWDGFVKWAQDAWDKYITPFFSGLWQGITGKELDPSQETPASQAGEKLGTWLKSAWDSAVDTAKDWLMGKLKSMMKDAVMWLVTPGSFIGPAISGIVDLVTKNTVTAAAPVAKGLEQPFSSSFTNINKDSVSFFHTQNKGFSGFLNGIVSMFRSAWSIVLSETDEAVAATAASIQSAFEDLRKLQSAIQELQSMRVALAEGAKGQTLTAEQRKQQIRAMTASEMQETLLDQTMYPDWYMKDYRDRFDGGVGQIVSAIQAIKGVPFTGGTGMAGKLAKNLAGRAQPLLGPTGVVDPNLGGVKQQ